MDYPLSEHCLLDDLRDVLDGYDVTWVDVRCASEEIRDARWPEVTGRSGCLFPGPGLRAGRGRHHGRAATSASPEACAKTITDRLPSLATPKAFDRLRSASN